MPKYSGDIRDLETGLPLAGVEIRMQFNGNEFSNVESDSQGNWELECEQTEFTLNVFLKGYDSIKVDALDCENIKLIPSKVFAYTDKDAYEPQEQICLYVHSSEKFYYKLIRYGASIETIFRSEEFSSIIQEYQGEFFLAQGLKWEKRIVVDLPNDLTSGLYGLQLINAFGKESVVPVILKPKHGERSNKMLVIANTMTWHANNTFGGKSRYHNLMNLVPLKEDLLLSIKKRLMPIFQLLGLKKGTRQEKQNDYIQISRHRPLAGIGLCNIKSVYNDYQNHLAGGEWRLLAWMEENGYTYDYYSDVDIQEKPSLLEKYNTVVLNTHSKYWGVEAFEKIFSLYNMKGLNVVNFGGNAMFSFVNSIKNDGFTIGISSSKEMLSGEDIFGVSFNQESYSSCSPYEKVKTSHFLFNGMTQERRFGNNSQLTSSIKKYSGPQPGRIDLGRPHHKYKLNGIGASGWEVDQMNSSNHLGIEVIAKGINKGGGAHMTFRRKSGTSGMMFSASSVAFSASLLVDKNVSKLADNVLNESNNEPQ